MSCRRTSETYAVAVDEAVAVEKFERENLGSLPLTMNEGAVAQFGSKGKTEPRVRMFATEHLIEGYAVASDA